MSVISIFLVVTILLIGYEHSSVELRLWCFFFLVETHRLGVRNLFFSSATFPIFLLAGATSFKFTKVNREGLIGPS